MCADMWASYVITSIFKTVTISVFNQDMKLHEIYLLYQPNQPKCAHTLKVCRYYTPTKNNVRNRLQLQHVTSNFLHIDYISDYYNLSVYNKY